MTKEYRLDIVLSTELGEIDLDLAIRDKLQEMKNERDISSFDVEFKESGEY